MFGFRLRNINVGIRLRFGSSNLGFLKIDISLVIQEKERTCTSYKDGTHLTFVVLMSYLTVIFFDFIL